MPGYLNTHRKTKDFLSCFNFLKRSLATAQSCCHQSAKPTFILVFSVSKETSCSISVGLPVPLVLSVCTSSDIPRSMRQKQAISNKWFDFSLKAFFMIQTLKKSSYRKWNSKIKHKCINTTLKVETISHDAS